MTQKHYHCRIVPCSEHSITESVRVAEREHRKGVLLLASSSGRPNGVTKPDLFPEIGSLWSEKNGGGEGVDATDVF